MSCSTLDKNQRASEAFIRTVIGKNSANVISRYDTIMISGMEIGSKKLCQLLRHSRTEFPQTWKVQMLVQS
jgi:hypothetical protein